MHIYRGGAAVADKQIRGNKCVIVVMQSNSDGRAYLDTMTCHLDSSNHTLHVYKDREY